MRQILELHLTNLNSTVTMCQWHSSLSSLWLQWQVRIEYFWRYSWGLPVKAHTELNDDNM